MNPHNTQLLYQRYPRLYPQPLPYDFECADGWFDLIDRLSADIEAECQRLVKEEGWQWADLPIAEQVKQKFGGLRFYLSDKSNATIRDLCESAEALAANTCENCGAAGERRTKANSRQVYTSCDRCLDQPLHR